MSDADTEFELENIVRQFRLFAEGALVRRLNAGAGFADSRIASQIYLRDESALARIAGGTLRPQGTHRKAADEIRVALEAADRDAMDRAGREGRWTRLVRGFSELSGSGPYFTLGLAIAYAIDHDVRELCHALAARRRPGLYLETCADIFEQEPPPPTRTMEALRGLPLLRNARLIHASGDGLDAAIEVAPQVLAWLIGDGEVDPPCELLAADADLGVVLTGPVAAAIDALVARADNKIAIVLRAPRGSGRKAAAHRLARALGRPLFVIPVPDIVKQPGAIADALCAARLRGAVPYLADADALYDAAGAMAADHALAIADVPGVIAVGSTGRGGHLELKRPALIVAMPRVELDDRERAWSASLTTHGGPVGDAAELAARYVIGPGVIADVISEAAKYATAAGTALDLKALEVSVARRLSLRLGTFGSIVARKALFSELVLPDDVLDTLHDMIAMVRERSLILERWGYQRHLGISRGVAGLFSGEPGTGKTMAASVVASTLGLELVRIDLSAVVSKYVGETEKNLGRIFDEAQDSHAMLLFDEADSLFGKRTELKSAQDRFANLEVNYILQRMETFDGVSVLTTNAESAIDPALQRRLNFRIRFPEPEQGERERLWRQLLPPATGLHDRVDFNSLAERFDMTGGYIKNAIVRAAVIAARAGRDMAAEDLWLGAHHEYVEMGKVMPQLDPPSGGSL